MKTWAHFDIESGEGQLNFRKTVQFISILFWLAQTTSFEHCSVTESVIIYLVIVLLICAWISTSYVSDPILFLCFPVSHQISPNPLVLNHHSTLSKVYKEIVERVKNWVLKPRSLNRNLGCGLGYSPEQNKFLMKDSHVLMWILLHLSKVLFMEIFVVNGP